MQDASRSAELEAFHEVLTDISLGHASQAVRAFLVDAYVRGYQISTAEHVPFEGSTAVFTRRRYRDKWNRTVVRRVSKKHNHSTVEVQKTNREKGKMEERERGRKIERGRGKIKKGRSQT